LLNGFELLYTVNEEVDFDMAVVKEYSW